jgi:hypothetical protein
MCENSARGQAKQRKLVEKLDATLERKNKWNGY